MKKLSSTNLVLSFLLLMIVVLLIFFGITYRTFQLTIRDSINDSVNLRRMYHYEQLLINIENLESSQRGYLLTGNKEFIRNSGVEVNRCIASLSELETLLNNDKEFTRQFAQLKKAAETKIDFIQKQISLVTEGKQDVAIANSKTLTGLQLMNKVKDQVYRMEATGREMLRVSAAEKRSIAEKANQRFILMGILAFIAFIYFFLRIRHDLNKRIAAEKKLASFNEELSRQVKEKTAAIQESESVYSTLVEQAADGIFLADSSFRYIDVNSSACRMLGYDRDELLKLSVQDITIRDESDIPFRFDELKDGKTVLQERKLKRKDGRLLPVEINAKRLDNGNLLATVRDITDRKDRERKQKIRERQLQLFVENSPVAKAMFDKNMNYIAVSKRWIADNHLENMELIGKNHYEVVPGIPKRWKDVHSRCLTGATEKNEMDSFEHPDGSVDWLHWEVTPWYTDEGEIGGIFIYTELLNEKLKMQASLKEKEQQYSLLIDRLTDGFIWLDNNWNYKYANKKIGEMTNLDPAFLLGKNVWELFPGAVGSDTYKIMHEVMEKQVYGYNIDYFPELDLWQENHVYPAGDGIYLFVRDVSEAKRAERKLAASEQNLRYVLSSASESFYVVDRDYRITIISDLASENIKKAWNAQVTVGTGILNIIPPATTEPIRESLEKAFAGEIVSYEFKRSYEGLSPWAEVSYMPVWDEQRKVVGVYIATKDITARKLAEEGILKEKQLSDSIINSLPGIFYLYDENGNFIRWNKNFETVSGYASEEMKKLQPLDFFEEKDKELLRSKIQEVFEKGQSEVEADFYTKDRKKIPYYFNGWRVVFEGKPCLIGVGIDITERKNAEKEILLANQRFKLISRATNDFVWDNHLEEGTVWWNDNYYTELGWKKEESKPAADSWEKHLHPEDKQRVLDNLNRILYASTRSVWTDEYRFEKSNGTYINVLDRGYIIRNSDGKPYRMLGAMTDVTRLKEATEELKRSEQKYKILFENNPMPLWMYSLTDLSIIDVNTAAISHYGYSREEFLSMTINDIRPAEDVQKLDEFIAQRYRNGVTRAGIWRHLKKDGTIIIVEVFSHDTIYDDKLVRLVLPIDVTDKIKTEEEIIKSREDIRRLAKHLEEVREEERTGIAREIHDELGQQLTVLKMDISWLNKNTTGQNEKVRKRFTEILEVIDETVRTVRRISSELRPGVLDNLGIVAAFEWQCSEFEKRTGIKTRFSTAVTQLDLPVKMANGMFRIFQESLTNIARHSASKEADVSLTVMDNNACLTIKDYGKGFDTENVKTKKTLGILGMKERTFLLNGQCNIKSRPGEGTEIELIVPLTLT